MADYVEKFKASDPFNMEGFNAKIDQINTAMGYPKWINIGRKQVTSNGASVEFTNANVSANYNVAIAVIDTP